MGERVILMELKKIKLELTTDCNQSCSFCPYFGAKGALAIKGRRRAPPTAIRANALLSSLSEVAASGSRPKIHLSGRGEALLHPDFNLIANGIGALGLGCEMITNGTLVRRHAAAIDGNLSRVVVSLHGDEKTHDLLCGRKGAYAMAMEGIGMLKRAKVELAFVITLQNFRSMAKYAAMCLHLGLEPIFQHDFIRSARAFGAAPSEIAAEMQKAASENPASRFTPNLSGNQLAVFYGSGNYVLSPHDCSHVDGAIEVLSNGGIFCCRSGIFGNIYDEGILTAAFGAGRERFLLQVRREAQSEQGLDIARCDRCCYQQAANGKQ
jgi:sulfatase maturation enzyme AslB (radical SAM superfamily)